jgi:hypothetical protein
MKNLLLRGRLGGNPLSSLTVYGFKGLRGTPKEKGKN